MCISVANQVNLVKLHLKQKCKHLLSRKVKIGKRKILSPSKETIHVEVKYDN